MATLTGVSVNHDRDQGHFVAGLPLGAGDKRLPLLARAVDRLVGLWVLNPSDQPAEPGRVAFQMGTFADEPLWIPADGHRPTLCECLAARIEIAAAMLA